MRHVECIVVGGGPAGLMATQSLLDCGVSVMLVDRSISLGGQLVKQTHKFFGSENQFAKERGFEISNILIDRIMDHPLLEIRLNTEVVSLFDNNVLGLYDYNNYEEIKASKIILATGASEKFLAFENNDCPQIMGAGAIQTLMNVYGVLPGRDVVMIGSGNIGLIVSYQLMQAGVNVKAIVDISKTIGGYTVHASKVRRMGVPFMMDSTIKRAIGDEFLEAVEIVSIATQESTIIDCDTCCIAVGLSPSVQLGAMIGVDIKYIPELGGDIIIVNDKYQSSCPDLFVCGDAGGIEEASSAMMEGALCGLFVAQDLMKDVNENLITKYTQELTQLREGPISQKVRFGLEKVRNSSHVT